MHQRQQDLRDPGFRLLPRIGKKKKEKKKKKPIASFTTNEKWFVAKLGTDVWRHIVLEFLLPARRTQYRKAWYSTCLLDEIWHHPMMIDHIPKTYRGRGSLLFIYHVKSFYAMHPDRPLGRKVTNRDGATIKDYQDLLFPIWRQVQHDESKQQQPEITNITLTGTGEVVKMYTFRP